MQIYRHGFLACSETRNYSERPRQLRFTLYRYSNVFPVIAELPGETKYSLPTKTLSTLR